MLVTPGGRRNGVAFVLGWLPGHGRRLRGAGPSKRRRGVRRRHPHDVGERSKLLLGLAAVALALWSLRGASQGEGRDTPKWMQALDRFTPVKVAGTAVLLSAVNPKNLLLAVADTVAIAQTGISAGEQAVAYAVFAWADA
jgi:hypothetical protein